MISDSYKEYISPVYRGRDYTDNVVGSFTILGRAVKVPYGIPSKFGTKKKFSSWEVMCTCGNILWINSQHVMSGNQKSCRKCYGAKQRQQSSHHWKGGAYIPGYFISQIRQRLQRGGSRVLEYPLSIEYLDALWERQEGRCALSGRMLEFETLASSVIERTVSLDRIDSSKGYIVGNVQFVHKYINLMKQDFSQDAFIELCKEVTRCQE